VKPRSLFDADAWVAREFKPAPKPQTPIVRLRAQPEPPKADQQPEKVNLRPEPFTPAFKRPEEEMRGISPAVRKIIVTVSRVSRVQVLEILGRSRKTGIAEVRQIAFWLARRFTGRSLPSIGEAFDRDHTTILHGVRLVDRFIEDHLIAPPEDTVEAWAKVLIEHFRAEKARQSILSEKRSRENWRAYSLRRRAAGLPVRGRQGASKQ